MARRCFGTYPNSARYNWDRSLYYRPDHAPDVEGHKQAGRGWPAYERKALRHL
jgi:hypothetical protein